MSVRRGKEARSFAECVSEALGRRKAIRKELDHYRDYVWIGEYGRILRNFRKWFGQDQIRVTFTEDLERDASGVLEQLYEYLAVDKDFVSPNMERRFHVGGVERIPGLNAWIDKRVRWLMGHRWAWRWKNDHRVEQFQFWLKTEGNVKPVYVEGPAQAVRERLREFYRNDVIFLQTEFSVRTPWQEFCDE